QSTAEDPFLMHAFAQAAGPYKDQLVTRAFQAGSRALASDEKESLFVPALLSLRDTRLEPLFLPMLQLPSLSFHTARHVLAGLRATPSPAAARGFLAYLSDHPGLPANLARPILQARRRLPKNDPLIKEPMVRRTLKQIADAPHGLLRDVFLTAAHAGDDDLA